jgi:hypothetical protein
MMSSSLMALLGCKYAKKWVQWRLFTLDSDDLEITVDRDSFPSTACTTNLKLLPVVPREPPTVVTQAYLFFCASKNVFLLETFLRQFESDVVTYVRERKHHVWSFDSLASIRIRKANSRLRFPLRLVILIIYNQDFPAMAAPACRRAQSSRNVSWDQSHIIPR